MRSCILDRLTMATKEPCVVAEADALEFVAHCDEDQYREYLLRCFGFESPFESACVLAQGLPSPPATTRPRSRYIAHDLAELGVPAEKLLEAPPCPLPPFRDLSQALGWLFVAERNVITNYRCHDELAHRAPDFAARASYLSCYGDNTDARWRWFGDALETAAAHADPERIAEVAAHAYDLLGRWLRPICRPRVLRRAAGARS
jgi:heme oxygenase